LLGGFIGFYLKNIISNTKGTVITHASIKRNLRMSLGVELLSIKKPGIEAPTVSEINVDRIPVNVTIGTASTLNQFKETLLGVLRIKILPIAAKTDPIKQ
jgi:hypothetical protein